MKLFKLISLFTLGYFFVLSNQVLAQSLPSLVKYHPPIACSNSWENLAQSCPSNVKAFITNRDDYPKYTSCPASSSTCHEEWGMMQTVEHTYLFVNADTGQASRWVLALTPEVKRPDGQIIQAGKKVVSQQATTVKDEKVGNLFNQLKEQYLNIQPLGMLTYTASGVIDGNGNYQALSAHHDSCKTAINYINNDNLCEGDLNTAIDLALKNEAAYTAFMSTLSQLGQFVTVDTPFGSLNLTELASFQWVIIYPDGSKLYLNIQVKNGHAAISVDLRFSRTSTNQTFSTFLSRPLIYTHSVNEAISIAQSKAAKMNCTKRFFHEEQEVRMKAVKVEGNKVTFIYEVNDIEKSFTYCG